MTTETLITLKITHSKALPEGVTDIIAQRVYGWCLNKGVPAGVRVILNEVPKEPWECEEKAK